MPLLPFSGLLNARQRLLYVYRCDVWTLQSNPPVNTALTGLTGVPVYTDFTVYTLTASSVPCLYWSTPELTDVSAGGLTKEVFLQTLDRWKFPAQVSLFDGDAIVCTSAPANFAFLNYWWTVQGNTQSHSTLDGISNRYNSNVQLVYGKITDDPPSGINQFP